MLGKAKKRIGTNSGITHMEKPFKRYDSSSLICAGHNHTAWDHSEFPSLQNSVWQRVGIQKWRNVIKKE
jgi:hypothetical protein